MIYSRIIVDVPLATVTDPQSSIVALELAIIVMCGKKWEIGVLLATTATATACLAQINSWDAGA